MYIKTNIIMFIQGLNLHSLLVRLWIAISFQSTSSYLINYSHLIIYTYIEDAFICTHTH